jgi:hypothetical protein
VSAESGYKLSSSYSLLGEYAVDVCDVDCGVDILGVDICDVESWEVDSWEVESWEVESCEVVDSGADKTFSMNGGLLTRASAI